MNQKIIDLFERLVSLVNRQHTYAYVRNYPDEVRHRYRLQQLKNALRIIKDLNFEITNPHQLEDIPGIGKGILRRIDEILRTGKLAELKTKVPIIPKKTLKAIKELDTVFGIGPELAKKYAIQYGIKGAPDLIRKIENKEIKVNHNIKMGLKYYKKLDFNIPAERIREIGKFLRKEIKNVDSQYEVELAGSFRRWLPTSKDIDVMILHPNYTTKNMNHNIVDIVDRLIDLDFLVAGYTYRNFKTRFIGVCRFQGSNDEKYVLMRIDIILIPYDSRITGLLHLTGPYEFNIYLRRTARKQHMKLSELGLFDENGKRIKITSEEELFRRLNIPYIPMAERNKYGTKKDKYF